MADTDFFEVTVKEAAHNDASRGIARLSVDVMKKLGLVSGDVIEIVGKRSAAAIVWPGFAEDIGFAILQDRREHPGERKRRYRREGEDPQVRGGLCDPGRYPAGAGDPARGRGAVPLTDAAGPLGGRGPDASGRYPRELGHVCDRPGRAPGNRYRLGRHRDRAQERARSSRRKESGRSPISSTRTSAGSNASSSSSAR